MSESPRAMSDAQFRALLGACADRRHRNATRDRVLFLFLGSTGLRVSEALPLTVNDLMLNDDPPCVRVRTLKRRGGREPRPELVDLSPAIARALKRWVQSRWAEHRWASSPYGACKTDTLLLFEGQHGGQLRRHQVHRLFRRYAGRAGLPLRLTLHSLRHYRASRILELTGDVEYARTQLRHGSLVTTQRYLHHTIDQRRRYLELLDGEPER